MSPNHMSGIKCLSLKCTCSCPSFINYFLCPETGVFGKKVHLDVFAMFQSKCFDVQKETWAVVRAFHILLAFQWVGISICVVDEYMQDCKDNTSFYHPPRARVSKQHKFFLYTTIQTCTQRDTWYNIETSWKELILVIVELNFEGSQYPYDKWVTL